VAEPAATKVDDLEFSMSVEAAGFEEVYPFLKVKNQYYLAPEWLK